MTEQTKIQTPETRKNVKYRGIFKGFKIYY